LSAAITTDTRGSGSLSAVTCWKQSATRHQECQRVV